jgi:membrane protein
MLHVDKYPSKNKTDTYWKPTFAARDLPHRLSKGIRDFFSCREVSDSLGRKNRTQRGMVVMEDRTKPISQLLRETATQWIEDQPFQLASSLSYYTIFSLAPLLIIVIAIAGMVFGRAAAEQEIVGTIEGLIGRQSAEAVQGMIQNASSQRRTGIVSAILGVLTLLLGASGVVGQLQSSLNTIWGVEPKPGQGVWEFVHQRFVSLTMILGVGFLLLVSLVVSALVAALADFIGTSVILAYTLDITMSFALITALFAMIYKFLPDVRLEWRDVWIGAALTAVLFIIGKSLIGLYLGHSSVGSTYGAAGSVIMILLWVYYSSLILFFGAEFTQIYASQFGSGVVPADHAEPLGSSGTRKSLPPEMRSAIRTGRRGVREPIRNWHGRFT